MTFFAVHDVSFQLIDYFHFSRGNDVKKGKKQIEGGEEKTEEKHGLEKSFILSIYLSLK